MHACVYARVYAYLCLRIFIFNFYILISLPLSVSLSVLSFEMQERYTARKASTHPNDSSIALTLHNPLYPPGRIIHIVRHHPSPEE